MKRKMSFIFVFLLFFLFIKVEAARAPEPIKSSGITTKGKEYPIEITHEEVTISSNEIENPKATIQYEFYNPQQENMSITMAFPLNYLSFFESKNQTDYPVLVDHQEVERKRMRYTLFDYDSLENLSEKINDKYKTDDFFHPDLMVYKNTYILTEERLNPTFFESEIHYDSNKTKIIGDGYLSDSKYYGYIENKVFEVYCIGENLDFSQRKLYDNSYDMNRMDTDFHQVQIEEMTFLEYINSLLPEDTTISSNDWYNIIVEYLSFQNYGTLIFDEIWHHLIEWVEYKISIPSQTTVLHEVSFPLYPRVDTKFKPFLYDYKLYLTSNFLMPGDSSQVKIKFDSPFYVSGTDHLRIEESGELYYIVNLFDETEFSFSICESPNPKEQISFGDIIFGIIVAVIFLVFLIPLIVLIVLCIKNRNKGKLYRLHWIEIILIYFTVFFAVTGLFISAYSNFVIKLFSVLVMVVLMILFLMEMIRFKKGMVRYAVSLLASILELAALFDKESDATSVLYVLELIFGVALIIMMAYSFDKHKKTAKIEEREKGAEKYLPVSYFSTSHLIFAVVYILAFFISGIFLLIFARNVSLYGLIVVGVILFWLFAVIGLGILITYRDFKPYRECQKDLDYEKLEKCVMEKLSRPKINPETINYHKILLASYALCFDLEKYETLVRSITLPKTKNYVFAYDTLDFNFLLSLQEFAQKKDQLKSQYTNKKIYLNKIKEFYFKWLIYYTGDLEDKTKTIDEVCPYHTKSELTNAVNLFIQIHYYYHHKKEEEFIKLKQLFLEKYSKLEVVKNKIEELE